MLLHCVSKCQKKWVELYPTIVSRAKTIEVISSGMMGSQSGTLQLVRRVLGPSRSIRVVRFCRCYPSGFADCLLVADV